MPARCSWWALRSVSRPQPNSRAAWRWLSRSLVRVSAMKRLRAGPWGNEAAVLTISSHVAGEMSMTVPPGLGPEAFYERHRTRLLPACPLYPEQANRWPAEGRHILAHYDDHTIIVYQAYRPSIGRFTIEHGYFGGGFSLSRMSWIKPNFLWMMYRCGWGTKEGQEVTLAVRLQRAAFDSILAQAVHSIFVPEVYGSEAAWKETVERSS